MNVSHSNVKMFSIYDVFPLIFPIFLLFLFKCYHKNPPAVYNIYQRPNGFYWLKVAFMFTILSLRKLKKVKKEDIEKLDQIQKFSTHEKAIDAVYLNGANKNGDHLVVGTARRKNRLLDGFLYLKLQNSKFGVLETVRLPNTALTQNEDELESYAAEGIELVPVEPMKRWRLKFEGKMKEFNNRSKLHDVTIEADWTSSLPIFNFDTDMDPLTMAKSLAYEKFSREFFKTLEANHQTHYEQHGELKGIATIDGIQYDFELNTVRDHSFGDHREWRNFWRYGLHFFSTENGDRFNVGKICMPICFSRLTIGYVYSAAENKMYPITTCDLELYQFGEQGEAPLDYAFSCTAGGKQYVIQVNVIDTPHFYISKDWESKVIERLCKFKVNGIDGWGAAEWQYRNVNGKNVPDFDEKLFNKKN